MQQQEILELAGLRGDGRKYEEIRPLSHNIGLISHADGSAYMEQGLNKVLAIVNGPHEPRRKSNDSNSDQVVYYNSMFLNSLCFLINFSVILFVK